MDNADPAGPPERLNVIVRSDVDHQQALISCRKIIDTMDTPLKLKQAIIQAVTTWMLEIPTGEQWLQTSMELFNVSHLAEVLYSGSVTLDAILSSHDVYELRVEIFAKHEELERWSFDSLLFDRLETFRAGKSKLGL